MRLYIFLFFLMIIPLYGAQEFTVNLKNPVYQNGVISTHSGGVISSPELRVQARHIIYTNRTEKGVTIHRVVAEGDLMLDSGGHTYVGRRLEYDFVTKTGVVYDGVTAIDLWFLGGEKIRLNSDRSFYLYNAFVTTSESKNADWKIHSREVEITKKSYLAAKNELVVNDINNPEYFYGIGDGNGDFLRKLNFKQKKYKKIQLLLKKMKLK